ncbi:MAG: hypothetical protein OEZ38_04430 [Gammaproteobacteria bacterium]|nr:hypothetical protein [Gammaproteobacteria bacterium]
MNNSLSVINSLLIDIKTINNSLLIKLHQSGFNTQLHFGPENEHTARTLIDTIETMVIHFLTITANRNQFLQRTSFNERKAIETHLKALYISLKKTQNHLSLIVNESLNIQQHKALSYLSAQNEIIELPLVESTHHIDLLKPYSRMLELIIAQERIHALSAVLETLLHTNPQIDHIHAHDDNDSMQEHEQQEALELSHYFIKQAL